MFLVEFAGSIESCLISVIIALGNDVIFLSILIFFFPLKREWKLLEKRNSRRIKILGEMSEHWERSEASSHQRLSQCSTNKLVTGLMWSWRNMIVNLLIESNFSSLELSVTDVEKKRITGTLCNSECPINSIKITQNFMEIKLLFTAQWNEYFQPRFSNFSRLLQLHRRFF